MLDQHPDQPTVLTQSTSFENSGSENTVSENENRHQIYRVRTQLLSKGRSDYVLASTDLMTVRIKCYAQGGENVLHSHPGEDNTFISR